MEGVVLESSVRAQKGAIRLSGVFWNPVAGPTEEKEDGGPAGVVPLFSLCTVERFTAATIY
eukprot:8295583-Lingulodinium_polyedra.AAC.1